MTDNGIGDAFVPGRSQDAWGTIRGFGYQVDLTIIRWVGLPSEGVLELERGEDIDAIANAISASDEDRYRLLEQVKCRSADITLSSPAAVASIANFLAHRAANPSIDLRFRFSTNAGAGIERPPAMRDKTAGIVLWERLRQNRCASSSIADVVKNLRKVLKRATRPPDLEKKEWSQFRDFVGTASFEDFHDLIKRFEWSMGLPAPEPIGSEIRRLLIESGLADEASAFGVHERLFMHVFRLLSSKGLKRLQPCDLPVAATASLSQRDRQVLEVSRRLNALETRVADHDAQLQNLASNVAAIGAATSPRISAAVDASLLSSVEALAAGLSNALETELASQRDAFRSGRHAEALKWISEVMSSPPWHHLTPDVRAGVLRLLSSLMLEAGNLARAQELADQARQTVTCVGQVILDSLLALHRSDAHHAIAVLGNGDETDRINFRAALLLESGDAEACLQELEKASPAASGGAEFHRVHALALLILGRTDEAYASAEAAVRLQPGWRGTRFTAAIVGYLSSVCRATWPNRLPAFPAPVQWEFVRRDDATVGRLERAARLLAELASAGEDDTDEQFRILTWRLACLGNDPARFEEASTLATELLQRSPSHWGPIAWSIARSLRVDLSPSRKALEEVVDGGDAGINEVMILSDIYAYTGHQDQIGPLYSKATRLLELPEHRAFGTFLRIRSQGATADGEALDPGQDDLDSVNTVILRFQAQKSGDFRPLIEHMKRRFDLVRDPRVLFELCELAASVDSWDIVADHAKELLASLGTPAVHKLATFGYFNTGAFDACLDLLGEPYIGLWPKGRLPRELRELRIRCLDRLGRLPMAVREAEALVCDHPETRYHLLLARVQLAHADLLGLARAARPLVGRADVTAEQALGLAQVVASMDPQCARGLFQTATGAGIPDDLVSPAYSLAHQLRLEAESGLLLERIQHLGREGRGGVISGNFRDLVARLDGDRDRVRSVWEAYRSGQVPVHLVAGMLNTSLINWYRQLLVRNSEAPNPRAQAALYFRHGWRGLPDPSALSSMQSGRIHVDLTSLLLAQHLEILDLVEASFSPMLIPGELTAALTEMRTKLALGQPRRLDAAREILELADSGLLTVLVQDATPEEAGNVPEALLIPGEPSRSRLLSLAKENAGYVLDFLPLTDHVKERRIDVPEDCMDRFVDTATVLGTLFRRGLIERDRARRAEDVIGGDGTFSTVASQPVSGCHLYCHANTPTVLAEMGILRDACSAFQLFIEHSALESARTELGDALRVTEVSDWLDELLGRVRTGIENGRYLVLPRASTSGESDAEADLKAPTARCLTSIVEAVRDSADVLWADDRHISGFPFALGGAPVIGIVEVLAALRQQGRLADPGWYRALARLRAGNARFIPLMADEILFHLRAASVEDGGVVESWELGTLRRYYSACMLDPSLIRFPRAATDSRVERPEVDFLATSAHAVLDALAGLWREDVDDEDSRIRSEWILRNLYLDSLGWTTLGIPSSEQDARLRVASALVSIFLRGVSLPSGGPSPRPRARFWTWVRDRIFAPRLHAEPELAGPIAAILKLEVNVPKRPVVSPSNERAWHLVMRLAWKYLPSEIHEELLLDSQLSRSLGLSTHRVLRIGSLTFDADKFWASADRAASRGAARMYALSPARRVTLTASSQRGISTLSLREPVSGKHLVFPNPYAGVLAANSATRFEALRQHQGWFDLPSSEFKKRAEEIAAIKDPGERIACLTKCRHESMVEFYAALREELGQESSVALKDLEPPEWLSILRHLRLPLATDFSNDFAAALALGAAKLVDELGPFAALERLAGLPVPLPSCVIEEFDRRPPEEARSGILQFLSANPTPMARFHALRLLGRMFNRRQLPFGDVQELIDASLTDTAQDECKAFVTLLQYFQVVLRGGVRGRLLSPRIRIALAWAHTHRVLSAMLVTGTDPDGVRQTLAQSRGFTPVLAALDGDSERDVTHPRNVGSCLLLACGLAYGLQELNAEADLSSVAHFLMERITQPLGDDIRIPRDELLRNPALGSNFMSSFVGGDRGSQFARLFGSDAANFSPETLMSLARLALDLARTPEKSGAWVWIQQILGDFHPGELLEPLREAVGTSALEGFSESPVWNPIPLMAAASQVPNFADISIRERVRSALLAASARLAAAPSSQGSGTQSDVDRVETFLVECAYRQCRGQDGVEALVQFVALIREIAEVYPRASATFLRQMVGMSNILPAAIVMRIEADLVRMRAG